MAPARGGRATGLKCDLHGDELEGQVVGLVYCSGVAACQSPHGLLHAWQRQVSLEVGRAPHGGDEASYQHEDAYGALVIEDSAVIEDWVD